MTTLKHDPGSYTLGRWSRELLSRGPLLLRSLPEYLRGKAAGGGVSAETTLCVHLRLARLQGCPVCLELFPRLAQLTGLSEQAVSSALEGRPGYLSEQSMGAMSWIEELMINGGDEPEMVPAAAMVLSSVQRSQLLFKTRLSLLVHSTGLMFLPHALIERAAGL